MNPYDFMENEDMPPVSNRGAQNTYGTDLRACVDWLQVTFKSVYSMKEILALLNLENAQFLDCNGMYGYRRGITNNGIFIFFAGSPEMGTHLQLTGSGCRYLENFSKKFDWKEFFRKIAMFKHYNVTRIDIALDDFNKRMKIPTLKKKIKNGECISRFKSSRFIETVKLEDGSNQGNTIYFGQPSSRLQIRFYEKNYQMRNLGIEHDYDFWNRYEVQLRKERAQNLFEIILKGNDLELADLIKGVLNTYVRFVNKDNNKNKARWKTYRPWQKFIDDVGKVILTNSEVEKDILESYDHLKKQYGPTLAMLTEAGVTDLSEIIQDGKMRLKDTHIKKMQDFRYNYLGIKKEPTQGL